MADGIGEFQDFTVATHWERFVALLEQTFRSWASTGTRHHSSASAYARATGEPTHTAVIHHQLPFRSESYTLAYFEGNQQTAECANYHSDPGICSYYSGERKLSRWFDVSSYITLEPNSYSKRILTPKDEGSTLLSALATALSNCRLPWPAFLPVYDPLRDAWWGIAISGLGTIHYDTDSIHSSKMPFRLQQVEGQLDFFSQQLTPHSLAARQACAAAASSQQSGSAAAVDPGNQCQVTLSMLRSYKLPSRKAPQAARVEGREGAVEQGHNSQASSCRDGWAPGAPWDRFANHGDPVGDLEVDMLWSGMAVEQVVQEGGFRLPGAASWRMHALSPGTLPRSSSFYSSKAKVQRRHLKLCCHPTPGLAQQYADQYQDQEGDSFTAMLSNLAHSRTIATAAKAVGDLASSKWWKKEDLVAPDPSPEENLQRVLADVFLEDTQHQQNPFPPSQPLPHLHLPKTAPPNSLLVRLALHIMCFSNPKAVAVLWQRFVRHLREACWDTGCLLPRMDPPQPLSSPGASDPTADQGVRSSGLSRPDFSCCLLHQKLQMLNLCIHQAHKLQPQQASVADTTQAAAGMSGTDAMEGWDSTDMDDFQEASSEVDGVPPSLHLLADPTIPVLVPITQEAPAMTEDMLLEQQAALAALDDTEAEQLTRTRLQSGGLLQADMAAFKAANPSCQLADFLRWHSPKDWHPDPTHPQGGALSDRMAHQGNVWQQMWQSTEGKAAHNQEPLMNAEKEAERVFHDLEQVPPAALWDQLLALSAVAAASMLVACPGAALLPAQQQLLQFQHDAGPLLEVMGSSMLQGEQSHWTGSPRAPHRRAQPPSAAQSGSDEDEGQEWEESGEVKQQQAESLVPSLHQLECVIVAGESLCRRLPGCPNTCSKLLQAALQSHDEAAVQAQSPDALQHPHPPANLTDPGDAHMEEDEPAPMLQPSPDLQQGEAPATQAGVQVKHEPERLVLDALMRYKPADSHQLQHGSVAECGDSSDWGDGLRTEWVCECSCLTQGNTDDRHVSHRLSVQAAPGEMRLATTMITQV